MSDPISDLNVLTAVLRHYRWAPEGGMAGRYEVWTDEDQREQIIVPEDPARSDFHRLVDRATRSILQLSGPGASELYDLLRLRDAAALDSTKWERETPVGAGMINWVEGEAIFEAARNSLAAAAKATVQKRQYFGNAQSYVSKQLLENSLMGQTEVGSFVVTAYVPSSRRFHASKRSENRAKEMAAPNEAHTVSGREVLATFVSALESIRDGLDEYRKKPDPAIFTERTQDGVSYELATALSALTAKGDASIQIGLQEAGKVQPFEVAFDAVESTVLHRASVAMVQPPDPVPVALDGEVSLLDNESSNPIHLVRLSTVIEGKHRKVRIRLTPQQYEKAIDAHRTGALLHVAGRLEREGKNLWLYEPDRVEVRHVEGTPSTVTESFDFDGLPEL